MKSEGMKSEGMKSDSCLVLDEAHRLKNPRSKLALALRALSAGGARCTLLTGTAPARNLLGTF